MDKLKMNTEGVVAAANNIKKLNQKTQDKFSTLKKTINSLSTFWEGTAANEAMARFNEIQSKYVDARYNVVNSFVNYMLQQVGQGYDDTESATRSLADAFK